MEEGGKEKLWKQAKAPRSEYRKLVGRKVVDYVALALVAIFATPVIALALFVRLCVATVRHCKRPFVVRDWRDS